MGGTVIGIDVGTTAVKAAVVADDGQLYASHSGTYQITRKAGGIAEQNPEHWVQIIEKALLQFEADGYSKDIRAIGLCSQVNTHVFVDDKGSPLMPAILWQDGRASAEAAELDAKVSKAQKLAWWGTPMPIDASHALPRMLWLSRHHPELWKKTRYVMLPKDYCIFRLTGELSTDPLSNIGLTDNSLNYIDALFDLVPSARTKMLPLAGLTDRVGLVRAGFAISGKPMINGTMDAWAGLVGAGGATEQSTVYLSGTSEILGISSNTVVSTPGAIVFPEYKGVRLHAAPTQSGGDAKKWFADAFNLSFDEMSTQIARTPRGSATPLFLPQLEGERAPVWNAELRGAFLGVTRQCSTIDFARAVYEGVAMSAHWALATLESSSGIARTSVCCAGNGFRSESWSQIRADVLGVELQQMAVLEAGVLGAAMMAMAGCGIFDTIQDASSSLARVDRVFSPDTKNSKHYCELFELYKLAITANATISASVAKTSASFS